MEWRHEDEGAFVSECGKVLRAKEGMCWERETLLSDTGGSVRREGGKVFAFVSAGAHRKAKSRELVRAPSGLPQQLQRRVAVEELGESGCSLGAEAVETQTTSRERRLVLSFNGR